MKIIQNDGNTIVHVIFVIDGEVCECTGVLMKEDKDFVQVAFNAVSDKVVDYRDIQKKDIINMEVVDSSKIPVL